MLKRLAIILAILSSIPLAGTEANDSISQPELCGAEQKVCLPESCFQQCLNDGEDPMDCPYYCYDHV